MKEALKELAEEQIGFICDECGITENELFTMDDDKLYDDVYDIEIAETPTGDDELTDHCRIASEIVTILGNALAMEQGVFNEKRIDGE